jgi:hypothetical protein
VVLVLGAVGTLRDDRMDVPPGLSVNGGLTGAR